MELMKKGKGKKQLDKYSDQPYLHPESGAGSGRAQTTAGTLTTRRW